MLADGAVRDRQDQGERHPVVVVRRSASAVMVNSLVFILG